MGKFFSVFVFLGFGKFPGLLGVLVKKGKITKSQAGKARKRGQAEGIFVGQILADMGLVTKTDLLRILAKEAGAMPHLQSDRDITAKKLKSLKDELGEEKIKDLFQKGMLPIYKRGETIVIAATDPSDKKAIKEVKSSVTFAEVVWCDWSLLERIWGMYQQI